MYKTCKISSQAVLSWQVGHAGFVLECGSHSLQAVTGSWQVCKVQIIQASKITDGDYDDRN